MISLLLALPAHACGGFFGPVGELISSDAQQAIFTPTASHVDVEYRVRFSGNAQDFAWVLPVPGGVMTVEEGDDDAFDLLAQQTAPQVYDLADDGEDASGCGCGASNGALKSDGLGDTGGGLVITGQGFAGDYEYTILAAEDASVLETWLTDNGFDLAGASSVLEAYVADDRGFEFVAVKVRQDVVELDTAIQFTPIRIRYGVGLDEALHLDFPALMQSTSTSETNHLEIYVLADGRTDVDGAWSSTLLGSGGTLQIDDEEDWATAYNDALAELSTTAPRLARIYSGQVGVDGTPYWVTRYDAIVKPVLETSDIRLVVTDNVTYATTSIEIIDEDADETPEGDQRAVAAGLLLGLGSLGALRARRR